MLYDLHCHSDHSDGELSPEQLVDLARERGVTCLAITDHDTDSGYRRARLYCEAESDVPRLISGIELSCVWRKFSIHVVGLNLNVDHPPYVEALARQAQARERRAETIAHKLQKKSGLPDLLPAARRLAAGSTIGRPHFAAAMLEQGLVSDLNAAFKRYLGAGKCGDVKTEWPELAEVVQWIVEAGGVAVLAHPLKYKMTRTKLRQMLTDFGECGGRAVEVASGSSDTAEVQYVARLARELGLLASAGSDFHGRKMPWNQLGRVAAIPADNPCVWELF